MSTETSAVIASADERAMRLALDQAQNAWLAGEVPVGAVIVRDDELGQPQLVATGYNRPITTTDPTAHAEIVALRHAAQLLGNYRLPECTLYVTLEPCAMCAMALMHARVKRVVYGARDPKTGAVGSVLDLFGVAALNHHTRAEGGCLEEPCSVVLRDFFAERREAQKRRHATVAPPVADHIDLPPPFAVERPTRSSEDVPSVLAEPSSPPGTVLASRTESASDWAMPITVGLAMEIELPDADADAPLAQP
jgi:tRNA(adenine34) deaminase